MKDGVIQQVDTPQNLYQKPGNLFVAGFMGSPQMNFLDAEIKENGSDLVAKIGNDEVVIPAEKAKVLKDKGYVGKTVVMGIRPEDVADSANGSCPLSLSMRASPGQVKCSCNSRRKRNSDARSCCSLVQQLKPAITIPASTLIWTKLTSLTKKLNLLSQTNPDIISPGGDSRVFLNTLSKIKVNYLSAACQYQLYIWALCPSFGVKFLGILPYYCILSFYISAGFPETSRIYPVR